MTRFAFPLMIITLTVCLVGPMATQFVAGEALAHAATINAKLAVMK